MKTAKRWLVSHPYVGMASSMMNEKLVMTAMLKPKVVMAWQVAHVWFVMPAASSVHSPLLIVEMESYKRSMKVVMTGALNVPMAVMTYADLKPVGMGSYSLGVMKNVMMPMMTLLMVATSADSPVVMDLGEIMKNAMTPI